MSESLKDNYLGGLRKGLELCTESLFFMHQSMNSKNRLLWVENNL